MNNDRLTMFTCWRINPFSFTSCETSFCSRSFSSVNSLFIAASILFRAWSSEASFPCFSIHLQQTKKTQINLIQSRSNTFRSDWKFERIVVEPTNRITNFLFDRSEPVIKRHLFFNYSMVNLKQNWLFFLLQDQTAFNNQFKVEILYAIKHVII